MNTHNAEYVPPKVVWVAVDDWHAIYVNGELIGEQDHSLSPWTWLDVLRVLGVEVEDLRYSDLAEQLAEEMGGFPASWPPAQIDGSGAP